MSIFVRARFDVLEGRRAEFEEIALALRKQAGEEAGTRTYRWFSAGEGRYVVLEEYDDEAAVTVHQERAAELLARAGQCAELVSAEVYGPVGPYIREWVRANPQATVFPDVPA